jgi:ubiquinone/menaquinone biosynthesis C-methylase UbiE
MPVNLDEYRKASYENWDRIAANWDSERDWIWGATHAVGERIVERADPQPGDTVLDIAAGTGDTGFLTSELIGSDGKLISTDFAPGMVEAAKRRGAEQGIENAEYRVLDAEKMDLDDDSIDKVVCRWGYMLMADPAAALAETRRVLRDGGKLSFSVWDTPDKNMWAAIPGMVLVERGHIPAPEPGAPGIFAMADPDRIRELVGGAGFSEPDIEPLQLTWPYQDSAEHWSFTLKLAGPLADAIGKLDEDEREAIRADVKQRIEAAMSDDGSVGGNVHVVTAS